MASEDELGPRWVGWGSLCSGDSGLEGIRAPPTLRILTVWSGNEVAAGLRARRGHAGGGGAPATARRALRPSQDQPLRTWRTRSLHSSDHVSQPPWEQGPESRTQNPQGHGAHGVEGGSGAPRMDEPAIYQSRAQNTRWRPQQRGPPCRAPQNREAGMERPLSKSHKLI